jgi:DNA-binding transcriptional MerR regulator
MTDETAAERGRRDGKSAAAFRTISEVATELDVPSHVLRFWETKFTQVRPLKRGGGRRYYRPEDVELLRRIRELLYREGYTIKGVQKLLREGGLRQTPARRAPEAAEPAQPVAPPAPRPGLDPAVRQVLSEILAELEALRALLNREDSP